MKNKHTKKQIFFLSIVSQIILSSCSTNPLLTENINLNLPEKKKMETEINRSSNQITYKSNLNNFNSPTESELLSEAKMRNTQLYLQNTKVLSDWISKNMSARHKAQLSRNCELLVGQYDQQFPLDERTIACSAWWVEKRNTILAQERKNNSTSTDNPVFMTDSQKRNWLNFQDLNLTQAISLIDISTDYNQQFYIEKALIHAKDCSLKNANAALILKLENHLPSQKTYLAIEKIYEKMQKCLTPNEEPAEKIHLRMGLLRLLYGNIKLAEAALKKTQLENDPKENSRNLFWLGTIYQKDNPHEKENPYWQQLIKENPLSLASIVAHQQLGRDPMSVLVSDENISLQNRVDGGWTKENLETYIFDILLAKQKREAAKTWANYVTKSISTTQPSLILFWSVVQNKFHNYFSSIQMLSRYGRYQKNYLVSRGLLDLQFPKAFLPEILETPSSVDPVFVLALMRQESAFDENARSSANARGLMQLLPTTAKTLKRFLHADALYDPDINIKLGGAYLEKLFRKYDGKAEYVLASYNAGSMNVDRWLLRVPSANTMLFCDFIPFKETRSYISIILRNYYWYSRMLSENNDSLTKKIVKRSLQSQFKPEQTQALLYSTSSSHALLTESQKDLLNRIYIFGNDKALNALSFNPQK